MIDWDEDENLFSDGPYGQFYQYDDYFSDSILKHSGFNVFKAVKKDNNARRQFVSELKSEGFLDSKEFESFDKWRTYALQAALIVLPAINEIKREIDMFNRECVLKKNIPIDFFGILYLKCVKGEKEKLNTYKMNATRIHVRSYHLSSFQKCPILSMRPLILVNLFTVSDIRRFSQDDEIEDYDDDDDDDDDDDYNTDYNTNRENTARETSLLESNFISRNPLIGNDLAIIKNSVVKCAPIVEASNCENTAPETSLLESNFISRNHLIGNAFDAKKLLFLDY